MEENITLEKFQEEAYNDVLATYVFDVEVAGKKSEVSRELEAKKQGIELHFLRYGIFNPYPFYLQDNKFVRAPEIEVEEVSHNKNDKKTIDYKLDEVVVKAKRKSANPSNLAPKLTHGRYERTGLRAGYLYILHNEEPKKWIEYKIDEYGTLYPIYWKHNKIDGKYTDIRDIVSRKKKYSYTVKPSSTIWVAYSHTQWSIKQLEHIQNTPEDDERMIKVECKGYEKDAELEKAEVIHDRPYHSFIATFNYTCYPEAIRLEEQLKTIHAIENADDPNNENTLLEDMFITLPDPVGCAYDLTTIIFDKIEYLRSMVECLASSVHHIDLYKYKIGLIEYGEIQSDKLSKKEAEELKYIFTTALTTYKFVYNNPKLKEEYTRISGKWYLNHGISHEKLDLILAIDERKRVRSVINGFRNDLGNLLKSEHYKNAVAVFYKNNPNPLATIEGKNVISDHLLCLSNYPAMVDRELLPENEYKPYEDKWVKEIIKTSKNESTLQHINELLFSPIEVTDIEKQDTENWDYTVSFSGKLISHFGKMSRAYIGFGKAIKVELLRNQFDLITRKENGVKNTYLVTAAKNLIYEEFLNDLKKINKNIASNHPQHKRVNNIDHAKIPVTYWLLVEEQFKGEINAKMQTHIKNPEKLSIHIRNGKQLPYAKKIEKIIESQEFRSTILVFEMFALMQSINDMVDKGYSNESLFKITGASIKFISAGLNVRESISNDITKRKVKAFITTNPRATDTEIKNVIKEINKTSFATRWKNPIGIFKGGAASYTLYTSIGDVQRSLAKCDNDAALAYSGATVISAVSLLETLGLISLAGVPGLIVGGLGLAFYGLAYYLTDDELETFFKFFPFSSQTYLINKGNTNPYYNARLMYRAKKELINPYKKEYLSSAFNESYKSVYVRLINLLSGSAIIMKAGNTRYVSPKSTKPILYDKNLHKNWIEKNSSLWSNLAIDISFGSFFSNSDELEYELYVVQHKDPLLGNKSYKLPKQCYDTIVTAPSLVNDEPTFIEQSLRNGNTNAAFKQFHIWVRVPKYLHVTYKIAANNVFSTKKENILRLNKHSHIAVLCKYTSKQLKLPLTPEDKQGYLFNIMPLAEEIKKKDEWSAKRNIGVNKAVVIKDKNVFFRRFPLQH